MDELNNSTVAESQTSQNEIKCSCCGAKLTFAPGTRSLKCEYCGTINEIKVDENAIEDAVKELDYLSALEEESNDDQIEEVHTVKCQACGAETTFDKNVISSKCDFCGSPLTINKSQTVKRIKPKALIPFVVEKHQGEEMFRQWLKDLWFAPSDLTKSATQSESLGGVYLPYWTYDAKSQTKYTGQRGIYYYTEERYKDQNGQIRTRQVRHTRWQPCSGFVRNTFDDIIQAGSTSLPRTYLESLEPWNLKELVPYDEKFMSGFKTETYSIDLKKGFQGAQQIMDEQIEYTICEDIGGDEQRISSKDINFSDVTFKHILLPIWISAFKYGDKSYRFIVNGQTGKVQGERPYSAIKIFFAVVAAVAVLTALFYILGSE